MPGEAAAAKAAARAAKLAVRQVRDDIPEGVHALLPRHFPLPSMATHCKSFLPYVMIEQFLLTCCSEPCCPEQLVHLAELRLASSAHAAKIASAK